MTTNVPELKFVEVIAKGIFYDAVTTIKTLKCGDQVVIYAENTGVYLVGLVNNYNASYQPLSNSQINVRVVQKVDPNSLAVVEKSIQSYKDKEKARNKQAEIDDLRKQAGDIVDKLKLLLSTP